MTFTTALPTRRQILRGLGALPAASLAVGLPRFAHAAEFSLKYGNNLPVTHPLNVRAQEAADRIAKESKGRVEIKIFPNNQLGGDTDMLAQVRSGGIDFFTPSALVIATLVPVAAINATGFAFSDYKQVWGAMDGKVGAHVRTAISKMRLHAFDKMWDNGFRQMTSSKSPIAVAKDMDGLKIRVPVSPLSISMFKGLGASPASLQFCEVYSALQTKIVDAQENPLPIIQVAKLYEVQKHCSLSNHIWDGFWFIANGRTWESLPADLKTIVSGAINDAAVAQREDIRKLNETLQSDLAGKGLAFNKTNPDSFRAKLREAGFYSEWKGRFGDEAWGLLEQSVGKLA
jgi:tripartite ATP-independent transporter DctP family solute receptor